MLEKSSGAVGCFHCQKLGAKKTCAICNRPVCDPCADGDTCPVPHRRELRLGLGRRLRAVSPDGTRGIVSGWTGGMALVDLATGDRLASMGFMTFGGLTGPWPALVSADRVVAAAVTLNIKPYLLLGSPERQDMINVELHKRQSGSEKLSALKLAISEDGAMAAVMRSDMLVDLVDLQQPALQGTISEPSATIQSLALSRELDLLVLGLYGRLKIVRLSDRKRAGTLAPRQLDGDVAWLGLSRGHLAAISGAGPCMVLQLSRDQAPGGWTMVRELSLESSATAADIVGEMPRGSRRVVASLSDDGELLAVRQGRTRVEVHPISGGEPVVLEGHTDRINLVRFVAGGKVLVTADQDNRVWFWPRSIIVSQKEHGEPGRS